MKNYYKTIFLFLLIFSIAGCATDQNKISDLETKIKTLENKIYSIQTEGDSQKIENLEARIAKLEKNYNVANKTEKIKQPDMTTDPSEPKINPANESSSIEDIQKCLKKAGFYDGEVDGKFGSKTKEAIELFQAANSLKVDGKVGPMTWEQLKKFMSEETDSTTVTQQTTD